VIHLIDFIGKHTNHGLLLYLV